MQVINQNIVKDCNLLLESFDYHIYSSLLPKVRLILFNVIVPLLLGGLIYIVFRSKSLILFTWFDEISISGFTNLVRDFLYPLKNSLPDWIIFSLPDGLWVYSFTSFLIIIWSDDFESVKYWMVIPLLTFFLIELLQLFNILKGTFDIVDNSICLIAFVFCVFKMKLITQLYEKQII